MEKINIISLIFQKQSDMIYLKVKFSELRKGKSILVAKALGNNYNSTRKIILEDRSFLSL